MLEAQDEFLQGLLEEYDERIDALERELHTRTESTSAPATVPNGRPHDTKPEVRLPSPLASPLPEELAGDRPTMPLPRAAANEPPKTELAHARVELEQLRGQLKRESEDRTRARQLVRRLMDQRDAAQKKNEDIARELENTAEETETLEARVGLLQRKVAQLLESGGPGTEPAPPNLVTTAGTSTDLLEKFDARNHLPELVPDTDPPELSAAVTPAPGPTTNRDADESPRPSEASPGGYSVGDVLEEHIGSASSRPPRRD